MKTGRFLFLFFLFLSHGSPALGSAPGKTCAHAHSQTEKRDYNKNDGPVHGAPSVDVVGPADTSNGIPGLLLRKRRDHNWHSEAFVSNLAHQGDPRNFILILGKDIGKFFGFEMLNENEMIVPTAASFQTRIVLWNRVVAKTPEDMIPLNFFESASVDNPMYLKAYTSEFGLPVFPTGVTFIHDISYHLPAIVLGKWLIRAKARLHIWTEFSSFLHDKLGPKLPPQIEKELNSKLGWLAENTLDGSTGNFCGHYPHAEPGKKRSLQDGRMFSPRDTVETSIRHLTYENGPTSDVLSASFPRELVEQFLATAKGKDAADAHDRPVEYDSFSDIAEHVESKLTRWRELLVRHGINPG